MRIATVTSCGALPLAGLLLSGAGFAAEPRTPHTYALGKDEAPPTATLSAAAMLVGRWEGDAFGSRFEETWNPPSGGSMVGMFKLYGPDGIAFYELMTVTVDDGALTLKVRHFNADFSAWEDKAEHVAFRLVGIEADALHFDGLSFYRLGDDELHAYLLMSSGEEVHEEKIVYQRVAGEQ